MIKIIISYILCGVLLLPYTLEILHLGSCHIDEITFHDNDLNIQSDNESCLFQYTFNNQLSDLKKNYSYSLSNDYLSKVEISEIIFYSKNYFCLNDKRGPPSKLITSKV